MICECLPCMLLAISLQQSFKIVWDSHITWQVEGLSQSISVLRLYLTFWYYTLVIVIVKF